MRSFVSVLCLIGFVGFAAANYCDPSLCSNGRQHVACNNPGWSTSCPAGKTMVDISPYKNLIVDLHNKLRNELASGKVPGYSQASQMATMQWDDNLAYIASFNVKQCTMRHDACRNTPVFKYSGQNLAYIGYSGDEGRMSNTDIITQLVNSWWDEYKNANMNVIKSYPTSWSGGQIGHFTAMARDSNYRVGCAAARYFKNGFNNFLLACNYATTNIVSHPVYIVGPAASACKSGNNSRQTGLCAANEVYGEI